MPGVVVDCSALSAVAFGEAEGDAVRGRLRGSTLHAPRLIEYEMANTAWKKARREPAEAEHILSQWAAWPALDIHIHDLDQSRVLALALETGLTAYDAAYLFLAEVLGCPLVTLDKQLEAAARSRQ